MSLKKIFKSPAKLFKNEYVVTIIFVLAILYGSLIAPKLPESAMRIVKHPIFLFIALVMIAYITTQNKKVAIIVGLALAITLTFVGNTNFNMNNIMLKTENGREELDELLEKKNNYPNELLGYSMEHFEKEEKEEKEEDNTEFMRNI
jgi:hypothetical protein